jgi:hypothetical protein
MQTPSNGSLSLLLIVESVEVPWSNENFQSEDYWDGLAGAFHIP